MRIRFAHYSRLSKNPPFPPFFKGGNQKSLPRKMNDAGIRAVTGRLPRGKGRFRGFFNLLNTTLTRPCISVYFA